MKAFILFSLIISQNVFGKDQFIDKQWAIKNNGQSYFRNISDLKRVEVKGIPGIDINYVEIPKEKIVKKQVIVAVIDSGIDLKHPDLVNRIWYNRDLCENAPNAKQLPCNGRNFLENTNDLTDDLGHGTHVAGIIAANKNNIGIMGATSEEVVIMPLKVMSEKVTGFTYKNRLITDVIAEAMMFAVKNKADVINLSLGWPLLIDTPVIRNAFKYAEDHNVMVVAASGNNNKDLPVFPCAYDNVVCVGSVDNQGKISEFSNYGMMIDILAPGDWIISTYPTYLESRTLRFKGYEIKKGSSQAAPYVAAGIANLKLANPELDNDEVRRRLFSSARDLNIDATKFTKFGLLDVKKLLENAFDVDQNILALVKEIGEVEYTIEDARFSFKLPLKNLTKEELRDVKVCFNYKKDVLLFDQECSLINLGVSEKKELEVSGTILDLTSDSHQEIEIKINEKKTKASFVFSRKINQFDDQYKILEDFPVVAYIGEGRNLSRMTKVIDRFEQSAFGEYFYLNPKQQTEDSTVVSLITKDANYGIKTIKIPKVNRLISMHRIDVNLDGKLDYMLYSLSSKRDELLLNFLDASFKPVFADKSIWRFKLSTFEGLPIENGKEKFEWLKINHKEFGNILIPSIYQRYAMPEADNSKKLAERMTGIDYHQFYLLPHAQEGVVNIELRVLDSIKRMNNIREKLEVLGAFDYKNIVLLKPLTQTTSEMEKGEISSLLLKEETGYKTFYKLIQTIDSFRIIPIDTHFSLETAINYEIKDISGGESAHAFTYLNNRANAQMVLFDSEHFMTNAFEVINAWDNPVLSLITGFKDKNTVKYLFENRYSIGFETSQGVKVELPVYRDSSFPGQSFSETFSPFVNGAKVGLFINSTLIFGKRIYAMQETSRNGFNRPISMSVSIPKNCVSLGIDKNGDLTRYNYSFICHEGNNETSLKFLSFPAL